MVVLLKESIILNKCDILSMEWDSQGRDIHIVEPVLCYLEKEYNLSVMRDSIWYGEYKLLKYKPKMLIIANATGASNNFNIMKLADKLGIKTVELISEGVYAKPKTKEEADNLFWGWNKDKKSYSDLIIYWSETMKRNLEDFLDKDIYNRIVVSGGTGFDRYKLLTFMNKETFCSKYNKEEYNKVVGIAGWSFDIYETKDELFTNGSLAQITDQERSFFINQREKVNEIYQDMIMNNKDVLFILKYHPATFDKSLTEFRGLSEFKNVIEIVTEEKIEDIINVSDLWICYESTTCLEAWLLNKQTIFANPESDFKRSNLHLGSPTVENGEKMKLYLSTYFENGSIPTFQDKNNMRKKLIEEIVGFDDGLSHKRAAIKIFELLGGNERKTAKIDKFLLYAYTRSMARFLIFNTPLKFLFFRKYKLIRSYETRYKKTEREEIAQQYRDGLNMMHYE